MLDEQVNVGINAGSECPGNSLGIRAVSKPFAIHIATIKQKPGCAILQDVFLAKNLRQLSEAAAPPGIDLPQSIPGRIKALYEKGIVMRICIDVGYSPFVDNYFCRFLQAVNDVACIFRDGRLTSQEKS